MRDTEQQFRDDLWYLYCNSLASTEAMVRLLRETADLIEQQAMEADSIVV